MAEERGRKGAILVIGGGIAGISTAIEAAEVGYPVYLVERESYLGGRVAQINQYFPKMCPPNCGLEINFKRIRSNPNITYYTLAEVVEVKGAEGNYTAKVELHPRYVNEKCTACGKCAEACQTEIPNRFNYGMDKIKAAYLPYEMAFPMRYVLAPEIIGTEDALRCQKACAYDAIELDMAPRTIELNVSAIVVAAGWEPYDATKMDNLGFGKVANVITNVMMERIAAKSGPTGGRIVRPSDGKAVKTVAFCQCAGQRDENHLGFCSRVCCTASMKQARMVREQYPDSEVYVFYIDLRAFGRNEDFLAKVQQDPKVHFVKGKVARITGEPGTDGVIVEAEEVAAGAISRVRVDMAVLATGMAPATASCRIPGLNVSYDEFGFVQDGPGVYGTGTVKKPLDVSTSVQDATGAALKAIQSAVRR
jgi:quinone-modifying oxidoreductase, subunit QmoA